MSQSLSSTGHSSTAPTFAAQQIQYSRDSTEEVVDMGSLDNSNGGYGMSQSSGQSRSSSKNIPAEVDSDREDGTEEGCRQLAKAFFTRYGYKTLGKFTKRGELSQFYLDTFDSWSSGLEPRHFKQVLFALVTDGKVCRVVGGGRFIKWNVQNRRNQRRSNGRNQRRSNGRNQNRQNGVSDELVAQITAAVIAAQNKSAN